MSCRLESRITALLFVATTLLLSLTTHGSVFNQNQRVRVRWNLQNGSKSKEKDEVNLEISERYKSSSDFGQSSDTYMLTPGQGGSDVKDLLQSDSPGFNGQTVRGKVKFSSTKGWFQTRPLVQCSPAAIILTAKGSNYINLLVDQVGASPVSILHLPSDCGCTVKVTWRDLILIAPYHGCYVLQQNGSYILPLLWWGMPVNISCPMTSAPATPSGFCSYLGITLKMPEFLRDIETYCIKVNEEWVPLLSNTCAYRVYSAPEDLIIFIPFTAQCAKDGGSTLDVLLDLKMYTLSCQPHHYISYYPQYNPAASFSQPLQSLHTQIIPLDLPLTKPKIPKKQLMPEMTTVEPQHQIVLPAEQQTSVPHMHVPSRVPQMPQLPQFPHIHSQSLQMPQIPQPPQMPQIPQPPRVPQKPQHYRFPVLANDSSQLSPVLTCKVDHFRVSLPSAKINSIKIKDVKRNVWLPVSSAPAHCGYSLQRKGKGVVFSSPLPACHSYTVSPSLLSLTLKFWDPAIPKHHTIRLPCTYTSPFSTTVSPASTANLVPKPTFPPPARHDMQPSHPRKPLGTYPNPIKQIDSHIYSQNFIVTSLYPLQTTTPSFQQSKDSKPTSCPPKHTWLSQSTTLTSQILQPQILCLSKDMNVTLPPGPITGLTVQSPAIGTKGNIKAVLLDEAPSHCGYLMKKNQNGGINILLPYGSCHMVHQGGQYQIVLKYQTANGHRVEAFLSCQVPENQDCSLPLEQQLACGSGPVSAVECHDLGCCYSPDTQTCYYPMDVCTADRHFVFSIPASLTEPPLLPALLVAAGNSSCTPEKVVADLALFKIPLEGCGTHKYEVGNAVIYMLEILNKLHSVTHHYGTITRDSPFRLLVECRYLRGTVASVGYLVKSPTLGPSVQAKGVFGVQLRIAKDQQYSSYYPQYHRPLRKLLGKPLYLEVRHLNPLDASTVLLVHYCVAYPRSAHSAWVLIYDGCPNPFDVTPSHEPPPTPPEGLANHVRRFTVNTFQFLEKNRKEILPGGDEEEEEEEEEIYFMCATEVCLPSEGPCVEGCLGGAVDSPAVTSGGEVP